MQKLNILLVSGAAEPREKLKQEIQKKGYSMREVHNLHDAFHMAKNVRPDVILVDDNFHKHSGLEMCEAFRGEVDTCYANIILLSSSIDRSVEERARQVGVTDVVSRSIDEPALVKRIEVFLGSS